MSTLGNTRACVGTGATPQLHCDVSLCDPSPRAPQPHGATHLYCSGADLPLFRPVAITMLAARTSYRAWLILLKQVQCQSLWGAIPTYQGRRHHDCGDVRPIVAVYVRPRTPRPRPITRGTMRRGIPCTRVQQQALGGYCACNVPSGHTRLGGTAVGHRTDSRYD